MATSPLSSTSTSSTGVNLSSLGSGAPLQITGLASGLDTNTIIQELMSIQQQPLTALQNQQSGYQSLNTNLSTIQSALQSLVTNAQALSDPTLFRDTQTVSSSNTALVTASTSADVGAVVGGYEVTVSQLASAAQQTFSYTPQSGPNTITIDWASGSNSGQNTYSLAGGATAQDLVNAVNSDSSGSVWATLVNGNIVFSDRTTGDQSSFTLPSSDQGLTAIGAQTPGQAASYTINGGAAQQSQSNTVTDAIPGVTLTLAGVTPAGSPVTVNVSPPSPSQTSIQTAVQNFVGSYNSVISQIGAELSQAPSTTDPTQGALYADPELTDLLNNMRQAMYTSGSGLPAGMASMMDIGVSTGATTGSATPSQNAISGQLTLNATTLTQALQQNPNGVVAVLQSWSLGFSSLVNTVAGPGGSIDSRVQSDDLQISNLGNQITNMQATLAAKQTALQQEYANLESALSQNQSMSSWLTSQINALPAA